MITILKKQTTSYYTYSELKEAAITYYLRDILERKSKIELLKLLESNYYPKLIDGLSYPFEYLGDEKIKQDRSLSKHQ